MIDTTKYATKTELFDFLKGNKDILFAQKMAENKNADAISFQIVEGKAGDAQKADVKSDADKITVKVVINTTNLMDSHDDVHVDGLWKKTLSEKKNLYHVQEHKLTFDHIISDEVKAYTEKFQWKDLGYDLDGETEALLFESVIHKKRNPFMFDQYLNKYVKNHSVGMRYVKLEMAINSDRESDREYKSVWDKYFPVIANKQHAESRGFFFVVKEARILEGSAVPIGSNYATPTLEIKNETTEPPSGTPNHSRDSTVKQSDFREMFKSMLKE